MKLKRLRRYRTGGTHKKMDLSIPIPKTPEGRVYRYSPNEHAPPRHFVLGDAPETFSFTEAARRRMKQSPRSDQTVCPYSGVIADHQEFTHPEDIRAATKLVEHAFLADMEDVVSGMVRGLKRQMSGSKGLKITVNSSSTPRRPRPRFSRRDLLRVLVCDHCGRDYGVFAIALFCPDCGAPNLRLHFARECEIVALQIQMADRTDQNEELAYRIMGNAHEDVLTAFEATLKAVYLHGKGQMTATKSPRNEFQNVEKARRRFAELNVDPFASLSESALEALELNIQKRHVIGHNLGIMDERFVGYAGGARVGETVHLVGTDVATFAGIAQHVVDDLDTWLAGGIAASSLSAATPSVQPPVTSVRVSVTTGPSGDAAVSDLANRLGSWLALHSQDGRPGPVDEEQLGAAFVDVEKGALVDAIAELSAEGYVVSSPITTSSVPRVSATLDLFATFDPITQIGDPVQDSLTLGEIVLTLTEGAAVADLHRDSGWSIRRFNPAIALVLAQIDDGHVSAVFDSRYPARSFHLTADDRLAIRRYIENLIR